MSLAFVSVRVKSLAGMFPEPLPKSFPLYSNTMPAPTAACCVMVCVVDVVTLSAVLPEMVTVLVTDVSPVF